LIRERPGEANDRERVFSNVDHDIRKMGDLNDYRKRYSRIKDMTQHCPECDFMPDKCICDKKLDKYAKI
jgi:hypothetical protein